MEKVLVTGATGFIGNYVVQSLLKQGFQVIASSLNPAKAALFEWFSSVEYIPLDIHNLNPSVNYYEYFQKPERLIHLAWEGLPNYKSDFHLTENFPQHALFLKNIVTDGLKDLTVAGTCFEYGLQEGGLKECLDVLPVTTYGRAKVELKNFLQNLQVSKPFNLKWVRLFYLFGKGQNPNSLISQLEAALQKGEKVFKMSGGQQIRDFIEVKTAAEILVNISTKNVNGGIINCCSGNPISVEDFVRNYLKKMNENIELGLGIYPYSDFEPMQFWGDTKKLNTILHGE